MADRYEHPGMDVKRLRYFLAVCEHGGFSKAAMAIGVSQPALTRHIQVLEQDLGVPLVSRNGRGAAPTQPGRFLLENARAHLEGLDSVGLRVRQIFGQHPVQLVCGICPTVAPLFLKEMQDFVREQLPNLTLSVIEAYSGDIRNLMGSGRLDFALTYHPTEHDSVSSVDLLSERLVVVRNSARQRAESRVNLATLARLQLILPSRVHLLRKIIDAVCGAHGFELMPHVELDSLNAVKLMLDDAKSELATILPYHSVREDECAGRFKVSLIDEPGMVRTVSLVMPAGKQSPYLPPELVEHVRDRASRLKSTLPLLF
jgi:DNA-binding transcriptional LysR family regulator